MKQYIKNGIIKYRNQIVLHGTRTIKDKYGNEKEVKTQIINPKEEQILADGWVEYVPPVVETPKEEIVEEIPEEVVVEDNTVEEETYSPLNNTVEIPVPEVSDKAAFVRARHRLRNAIQSYDSSSEVNCFYVEDEPLWLDKSTRTGLMLRFQSEQLLGDTETTLWYGYKKFVLPLDVAQMMLHRIEKYASQCYDNTQMHLANINTLKTLEDVQNYDYKSGYPEKLKF